MICTVPWNEILYLEFGKLAMLSDIEKEVLRTRIMGYTITQQSMILNVSESTVNRIIAQLKQKYDDVQKYSDKLSERRTSSQEDYMDSN